MNRQNTFNLHVKHVIHGTRRRLSLSFLLSTEDILVVFQILNMVSPCACILLLSTLLLSIQSSVANADEGNVPEFVRTMKEDMEKRLNMMQQDIEERVSKLEQLARIGTLRSCSEYAKYGLHSSGPYIIDPDGPLLGQEPFQVYCNFTSGLENARSRFKV